MTTQKTNEEITEEFLPVSGYAEFYEISNLGRLKNLKTNKFISGSKSRYQTVILKNDKSLKPFKVHRLVALHFIQNPKRLQYVNHKDGNKLNNRVDNLEWVTKSENMQHAYDTGLLKNGEDNVHSIATEKQVKLIKHIKDLQPNINIADIGRLLKLNYNTVYGIWSNRDWKHIKSYFEESEAKDKALQKQKENIVKIAREYKEKYPDANYDDFIGLLWGMKN